jgi:hypothetical protein
MGNERKCVVSFRDQEGVEHVAEVIAESLYEAGALALQQFVERLIGTIRREYVDHTLFWTATDLENKLRLFQGYFNRQRVHSGLRGRLPDPAERTTPLNFDSYRWQQHCHGLYQTPTAA